MIATQKLFCIAPAWANERELEEPKNAVLTWRDGTTARIQISGVIDKQLCAEVRDSLVESTNDSRITDVLFQVDSPGGSVAGVGDLAATIRKAREQKPIVFVVDNLAASAAYWLASSSTHIVASPSAMVGSIGVVSIMVDASELHERIGVKVITIATGKFKGAGAWGSKLTGDQVDHFQHIVDQYGKQFVAAVARGRGMSPGRVAELADGRVFLAHEAKAAGLIDEVMAADNFVDELLDRRRSKETRGFTIAQYEELAREVAGKTASALSREERRSLVALHPECQQAVEEFDREQAKRLYEPGSRSTPWNQPFSR